MSDNQEMIVREYKGVLEAVSPQQRVERATEVANALAPIVEKRKLYSDIRGKKYVRVEGWTTMLSMLGIVPREVASTEHEDGSFSATVELYSVNLDQIVGRGSAKCGMDENSWKGRASFARKSMAITRATGKAARLGYSWIMELSGYQGTPAEEMTFDDKPIDVTPQPSRKPRKSKAESRTYPKEASATPTVEKEADGEYDLEDDKMKLWHEIVVMAGDDPDLCVTILKDITKSRPGAKGRPFGGFNDINRISKSWQMDRAWKVFREKSIGDYVDIGMPKDDDAPISEDDLLAAGIDIDNGS